MKIKHIAILIGPIVECDMTFREFIRAGFSRPGTLVWLKDSTDAGPILIGDANVLGGGCDDCPEIQKSELIRAHCRLTLEII